MTTTTAAAAAAVNLQKLQPQKVVKSRLNEVSLFITAAIVRHWCTRVTSLKIKLEE